MFSLLLRTYQAADGVDLLIRFSDVLGGPGDCRLDVYKHAVLARNELEEVKIRYVRCLMGAGDLKICENHIKNLGLKDLNKEAAMLNRLSRRRAFDTDVFVAVLHSSCGDLLNQGKKGSCWEF